MAGLVKLICVAFFLAFVVNAYDEAQCPIKKKVLVTQKRTGKKVAGRPEFNVTVTNTCFCTAIDVNLWCAGFQSAVPIDGAVLSKFGDACGVNHGEPIHHGESFSFTYAWDRVFPFRLLSGYWACS